MTTEKLFGEDGVFARSIDQWPPEVDPLEFTMGISPECSMCGATPKDPHIRNSRLCCQVVYVTLWHTEQRYGGPEEGGWYWTHRQPENVFQTASYKLAAEVADALSRYCEWENEGAYPITSVRSSGIKEWSVEPRIPTETPRPRYE